jgi:predicted PurR-regulated permease PerM
MNPNLTSTKFIISVLCLIVVSIGFFLGKITSEIFMPFILGILGIFTAGNVVSKKIDDTSAN